MRHDYDYHPGCGAGRVELELSLKPYVDRTPEGCRRVAETLFRQWMPLIRAGTGCSVLLWVADGSEILDYTGREEDDFPWCQYIGCGNPTRKESTIRTADEWHCLHIRPFPYRGTEHLTKFTYGDLKHVVAAIKEVGREMTGETPTVIETFDPGPEFAPSDFKFRRHKEISSGSGIRIIGGGGDDFGGVMGWVNAAGILHADDHTYATYPRGIPEGTTFGEFFGRQCRKFCDDIGFDGIWLSNGLGFDFSAWNWLGEMFDGNRFSSEKLPEVKKGIQRFWEDFTREFGDGIIEARGSNLSTAMDICAHGCPIDTIYSYHFLTPPNSPWAALNGRFGLELVGYLSHIAEMTDQGYLFRYYIHDPWWYNSPWFDRYGGNPHDIYLPLSTARLDEHGDITRPAGINLLSCDDSFGNLPERCPIEVIPHLLAAFDAYSDAPGLITWVYPFAYNCQRGLVEGALQDLMLGDWYMESAVDAGFPLNTVISDTNFASADPAKFHRSIIVTSVPAAGTAHEAGILKALGAGVHVLLYGATERASEKLLSLIGVRRGDALSGTDFAFATDLEEDTYEEGRLSHTLRHVPLVSGGALTDLASGESRVMATVSQGSETRAYATYNETAGLAWVRGSFPHDAASRGQMPASLDPEEFFPTGVLLRWMLSVFGIRIRFSAVSPKVKLPLMLYPACRGGYYQNGFSKNTTVKASLSSPLGAPLAVNCDAVIEKDTTHISPKLWSHDELRLFIRQEARSSVTCRYECPERLLSDHRILLTGLKDATVTFLAPPDTVVYFEGDAVCATTDAGDAIPASENLYVATHCNGTIALNWQTREAREELDRIGYLFHGTPKNT